jgi:very-short-patch-repair endonuclease
LRVIFEQGLRLPVTQFEVRDEHDRFVCRADFAYPDLRLLIEVDGRSYHSDTVAFQRDRDKQNRTQELGWRTLRFTWNDVSREPDRLVATLSSFLRN